jgi:hypothetical protein
MFALDFNVRECEEMIEHQLTRIESQRLSGDPDPASLLVLNCLEKTLSALLRAKFADTVATRQSPSISFPNPG